jgi:hypothetical protein
MLPHSFLKMPECGGILPKLEKQKTGDKPTERAAWLPVTSCQSRLDEALLKHLLIAEPQIRDVG